MLLEVESISTGLRGLGDHRFLCVSEGECTREMGAGQFNIFGASEEKGRRGFPELEQVKERLKDMTLRRKTIAVLKMAERG